MKLHIKYYLGMLLLNNFSGNIIKYLAGNIIRHGININTRNEIVMPKIAAHLFFGSYESAEIRFIKKYLKGNNLPVLELGSSLGIVGSIASKYTNRNVFGVEANKDLLKYSTKLINENHIKNYKIHNFAINISDEPVSFNFGTDNTLGKLSEDNLANCVTVQGLTFNKLLNLTGFSDKYILISDVEGAEIFYIFFEANLSNCKWIIVELHEMNFENTTYTVNDMEKEIIKKGFLKIERHGNCFVFKNLNCTN